MLDSRHFKFIHKQCNPNLENEKTYEVEVGCTLELLQQIEGEEGQESVLRSLDEVVLKYIPK